MAEAWRDQLSQLHRTHAEQRGLDPAAADGLDFDDVVRAVSDVVTAGRVAWPHLLALWTAIVALAGTLGWTWLTPPEPVAPQQIAAAVAAYEQTNTPTFALSAPPSLAPPVLVSLPVAGGAAEVEIVGPSESAPGDLIVLEARGEYDSVKWILGNSTKTFLAVDDGKRVVFASGTPGEYRFFAVAANLTGEQVTLADDTHTVVIGNPGPIPTPPNPTPPPTPVPPPTPTPVPPQPVPPSPPAPEVKVTGLLAMVVVRDAASMTADQSAALLDLRVWADKQNQSKAACYIFDDDASEPVAASYRQAVPNASQLPYAFLVDFGDGSKASILWEGELPAKATELIDRAEELLR